MQIATIAKRSCGPHSTDMSLSYLICWMLVLTRGAITAVGSENSIHLIRDRWRIRT